jgi:hypothetical protein
MASEADLDSDSRADAMTVPGKPPEQVEDLEDEESSEDPASSDLAVQVEMPRVFKIKIVDVSALQAYEEWAAIASIFSNIAIGFSVAVVTSPPSRTLFWTMVSSWLVFTYASFVGIRRRRSLSVETKSIDYRVSRPSGTDAIDRAPR